MTTKLTKQEQKIRDEIKNISKVNPSFEFEHDDWRFYVYFCDEPMVTAWNINYRFDAHAKFIIKGDYVELHTAGIFREEWHEIKNILDRLLIKEVTMEGKE